MTTVSGTSEVFILCNGLIIGFTASGRRESSAWTGKCWRVGPESDDKQRENREARGIDVYLGSPSDGRLSLPEVRPVCRAGPPANCRTL